MSNGYVSLEEAREAVRQELLAHMERVLGERSDCGEGVQSVEREGNAGSLDSAEKRGSARDDRGGEVRGSARGDRGEVRGSARDDRGGEVRGFARGDRGGEVRNFARDDRGGEVRGSARGDRGGVRGSARGDRGAENEGSATVKPIVIDVPFEAVRTAEQVRAEQVRAEQVRTIRQGEALGDVSLVRCQRVMADGKVCGLPAHDGTDQCARHYRWYSLAPNYYGLPYPENATAVQEILARVAALVLRKQIEPRIGETVARLCREMSRNLAAYQRETEALRRECVAMGGPKGVQ